MAPTRDFRAAQTVRGAILCLSVAVSLPTLSGCSEAIKNTEEDNSYLLQPSMASDTSAKAPLKSAPLLPVRTSSWRNKIITRRTAGSTNGNRDPNVDDQGNPFLVLYEKVTARPVGSGGSLVITSQVEKQSKDQRIESYLATSKGVSVARVNGEPFLAATPPIPLFRLPIREQDIIKWTGSLQLEGKTYSAQAYSRLRSPEALRENSKALVYRVDTVLIVNDNGRPVSYSMSRWFQPGVGIVRQRYYLNNLERVRERVSTSL